MFGFSNFSYIPIHIAIIYSVVSLICYSLSANARSLLINKNKNYYTEILSKRILLALPIFIASIAISSNLSNFSRLLIFAITVRRIIDWIDEVIIQEYEISNKTKKLWGYFLFNIFTLFWLSFAIFKNYDSIILFMIAWSLSPIVLNANLILKQLSKIKKQKIIIFKSNITSHLVSSASVGLGTLFFRLIINKYFDDIKASQIITAISIGAVLASLFSGSIGTKIVEKIKVQLLQKILISFLVIFSLTLIFFREFYVASFFYKTLLYSTLGSAIMMLSQIKKNVMLFSHKLTAQRDFWVAILLTTTTLIICAQYNGKDEIVASLYLISAVINFLLYL
jgi:hypothetical protein